MFRKQISLWKQKIEKNLKLETSFIRKKPTGKPKVVESEIGFLLNYYSKENTREYFLYLGVEVKEQEIVDGK